MAEKIIGLRIQVKGTTEQEKQMGQLEKATIDLKEQIKVLNKVYQENGSLTDRQAQRLSKLKTDLKATQNAYRDTEAAVLKQNDALRKNSGFVSGIQEAISGLNINLGGLGGQLGVVTNNLGTLARVSPQVGLALAGIAAVGAPLVSFFTRTSEGADGLKVAMGGISAASNVFMDRLAEVGRNLIHGEGLFDSFTNAFKGFADEVRKETKIGEEIARILDAAEDYQRDTEVFLSRNRRAVQELLLLAQDENITKKEKLNLLDQAILKVQGEIAIEEHAAKLRLEAAQKAFEISNKDEEARSALNKIIIENENKKANLLAEERSIQKQIRTTTIGVTKEIEKQNKELEKQVDITFQIEENNKDNLFFNDELAKSEKERLDKAAEVREASDAAELNAGALLAQAKIDKNKEAIEQQKKDEQELHDLRLQLANDLGTTLLRGNEALTTHKLQQLDKQKLGEKEYNRQVERIRREGFRRAQALESVMLTMNWIAELSAIWKNSALNPANAGTFGAAGAAQGALLAGIATARYAAGLASLKSQQFAEGGFLTGNSHANGGIPFTVKGKSGFEAEGGESIINKQSTSMYRPLLSAINQAGGGVAFARGGEIKKFASGGVPNYFSTGAGSAKLASLIGMDNAVRDITANVQSQIGAIKVVNVVTDTTSQQVRVQNIQREATIL